MDVDTVNSPPAVTPQSGEWVRTLNHALNKQNSCTVAVYYVLRRRLAVQDIIVK